MSRSKQSVKTSAASGERNWRILVERSLRGRSADTLAARSDDDLNIGPIYHASPQPAHVGGRIANHPWVVVQRLDLPDSRQAATSLAADLTGGANGIEFVFAGSAGEKRTGFGLAEVADRLVATMSGHSDVHVRLDAGEATWLIYDRFRNLRFAELALACDSLAHGAASGGFERLLTEIETGIVELAGEFEARSLHGTVVEADGRVWAAAGASEAQELAGILGSLAHHARLLIGAGTSSVFTRIGITVDASANQPMTVAKLRAARLLHARLVEAFELPPVEARIHAETSWRMMTRRDVHTNILRTTSAAFAAGIGGADSITVLPFTVALGLPDAFARRVARNLQIILIEEGGLARVGDPGAGSGAVERLTADLAEAAWNRFRAIEAEGGLLAALRSGSFQRDIARMRGSRAARMAVRKSSLTGVSEFPALDDANVAVLAPRPRRAERRRPAAESFEALPAMRLAEPFEALRDRADALAGTGKAPEIFLADLGALADHAGTAQAARNFFAIGGIRAVDGRGFAAAEAAAEAFAASGAAIACIVGTAETVRELGAPTAAALKTRGAKRVYLMGGTTSSADIDAVLGDDVNALDVLDEILRLLG